MDKKHGMIIAIIGTTFWGLSGVAAQAVLAAVSSLWLVGLRLLLAGVLLLIWAACTGTDIWAIFKTWHTTGRLFVFAILGMVPSQLCYFLAIHYGNAATATVLQFLGPLFIIATVAVETKTMPRRIDLISMAVALLGTVLLVTEGNFTHLSLAPLAVFWGVLAGASQASYTLVPRKLLRAFDAKIVVGWSMVIGSVLFWPTLLLTPWPLYQPRLLLDVAFIVVFGTMLAYLLYLGSLRALSPQTVGMISACEPLSATLFSWLLLGTTLAPAALLGGALVICTVFLQALPVRKVHLRA